MKQTTTKRSFESKFIKCGLLLEQTGKTVPVKVSSNSIEIITSLHKVDIVEVKILL